MRIAVIDYRVATTNPIGGCHRKMIEQLCENHQITVFAVEFENPRPDLIDFVRIRVPGRPLFLLFAMFHLIAPIYYWLYRLRTGTQFDLVQTVESNSAVGTGSRFGQVSYSQFCHRRFLDVHWPTLGSKGVRGFVRWLDHQVHALLEPLVYRRVKRIVVASQGLARELKEEYPFTADKIRVLANPVDIDRMTRTADFDREAFRAGQGLKPSDTVLLFIALGHYERKGLPLLLEAMTQLPDASIKLNVVGGRPDLIASYQRKVESMGLAARVIFSGMQRDVRPHLWSADVFMLPSAYEVFPLVALESAAAGLPMISAPLNGVEEFLRDGMNGFLVERTPVGIRQGILRFLSLDPAARAAIGKQGQKDVSRYSTSAFGAGWRTIWADLRDEPTHRGNRATARRPAATVGGAL